MFWTVNTFLPVGVKAGFTLNTKQVFHIFTEVFLQTVSQTEFGFVRLCVCGAKSSQRPQGQWVLCHNNYLYREIK